MSVDDEQVVALLRRAVERDDDASGISPGLAARTGRRRSALRTAAAAGAAALAVAVLAVATVVVPGLVDRAGPAGPSVSVSPEPTQNPVRRLYAAYDAAIERNGLPLADTRWTVDAYVRLGAAEPQRFTASRSLHNLGTPDAPVSFQTVELHEADLLTTDEELCGPYRTNGMTCEIGSPGTGLTLVRLRTGDEVVGAELWHPGGVVTASRPDGAPDGAVTEAQLLDLVQDPALRW